jgi:hypothetical protein
MVLAAVLAIVALVWLPGHEDSSSSPAPGELVRYRLEGAPQPIAVGSGAAWASLSGVDEGGTFAKGIWRIDSRTGALREVPGTIGALWPAVGEGGVWVTCNAESCGGPMVLQLDPAGGGVERSIPLPDRAAQITIGLGRVWVTLGDGGIVGVDPATGEIDRRIEGGFDLIGSDGEALWATTLGGGSPGVVRLDPETGEQLASYEFPDPCNLEVSGGYVFVASCDGGMHAGTGSDELAALAATTGTERYRVSIDGYGQMRLADGTLWIAQGSDDGKTIDLIPLDPSTGAPTGATLRVPHGKPSFRLSIIRLTFPPHVFFAVGEGSLWFTDYVAGEVLRIGLPVPNATSGDPRCLSDDADGLISCEEALQIADRESGIGNILAAEARLTTYRRSPDSPERRVWAVTYHDVQIPAHGPPGSVRCWLGDWKVTIDAETGRFLFAGTSGPNVPCPSPSP